MLLLQLSELFLQNDKLICTNDTFHWKFSKLLTLDYTQIKNRSRIKGSTTETFDEMLHRIIER